MAFAALGAAEVLDARPDHPAARWLLHDAAVTIDGIDLFAVVAGPGSFTGLRVGIATIQGLAMAEHKKVVALSALAASASASMRLTGVFGDRHYQDWHSTPSNNCVCNSQVDP